MEIVINRILRHLRSAEGDLTLFAETELAGTVTGTCQVRLSPEIAGQLVRAIIEDGVGALRDAMIQRATTS